MSGNPDNMSGICNAFFYLANLVAFIGSIPVLAMSWLMMTNNDSYCNRIMYPHLLDLGTFLMITSLCALIGLSYRLRSFLWIYLILVAIRTIVHIVMTAVVLISIHNQKAFGKDYSSGEEYKVDDFSGLAKNYIDGPRWASTKTCIIKYNFCQAFDRYHSYMSPEKFMQTRPVLWGCCQPPASCGYQYQGDLMWSMSAEGVKSNDTDCYKYLNNQEVLCSECDTCKAGFLASIYKRLLKLVMGNSVIVGMSLIMIIADLIVIRDIRRAEEKTQAPKL